MTDEIRGDYKPTKGLSSVWGNSLIMLLLVVWCSFSLFAFFWVVYTSLKGDRALFKNPWSLPNRQIAASLLSATSETTDNTASDALDGKADSFWATAAGQEKTTQEIAFDLGGEEEISKVVLDGAKRHAMPQGASVWISTGGEWERVEAEANEAKGEITIEFAPVTATKVKVAFETVFDEASGTWGAAVSEVVCYRDRLKLAWENYKIAWTIAKMGSYTWNSIIVTFSTMFFTILLSSWAAFGLTKLEFRGQQALFYYFLAGLAVPGSLLLVPLFMLLKDMNIGSLNLFAVGEYFLISINNFYLVDSRIGLILIYTVLGLPFTIFVLTGFFRSLPTALAEAAAIDGASEYTTFWKIYLPLAKPGIVTVSIFGFLGTWNEYQFALVFISNPRLKTLPLGLYGLTAATRHATNWTALFAGLVILILPTIIIFLLLEDRITKGLTMGAVKT